MRPKQFLSALTAAAMSALATVAYAQAPAPDQDPFSILPFNNPQQLLQLAALDDSQFLQLLFDDRSGIIERFFPPGTVVFPQSHGFSGPQDACLRTRTVTVCRFYVADLITVNLEKEPRNGVLSNPFAPAR